MPFGEPQPKYTQPYFGLVQEFNPEGDGVAGADVIYVPLEELTAPSTELLVIMSLANPNVDFSLLATVAQQIENYTDEERVPFQVLLKWANGGYKQPQHHLTATSE